MSASVVGRQRKFDFTKHQQVPPIRRQYLQYAKLWFRISTRFILGLCWDHLMWPMLFCLELTQTCIFADCRQGGGAVSQDQWDSHPERGGQPRDRRGKPPSGWTTCVCQRSHWSGFVKGKHALQYGFVIMSMHICSIITCRLESHGSDLIGSR